MDFIDDDHDHDDPFVVTYSYEPGHGNFNRNIIYISMVSFTVVLLLLLALYLYARCVLTRRSRRRRRFAIHRLTIAALHVSDFDSAAHRRAEPPNTGLDPALVASLPTFTVGAKVLEGGGSAVECAVCLSALEGEEKAKLLPNCNHFFHVGCIDTWLGSHSTCPLCRAGIQPRLEPQNREGPVGLALDGAPAPFGLDSGINGSGESSKINGSNSRLSSFRRVLSTERSSRRIQPSSHDEDDDDGVDLERQ